LFERLAIDVLKETDVQGATRILRISWDEAWSVMERAVKRGLLAREKRVVTRIGVDEKAVAKGQTYVTLVYDLERATVEHIADERKQESLDGYFKGLSDDQLSGIQAIAMDMWEPFFNSAKAYVPDAAKKIVFDRFHILAHMGKAVDDIRRGEHRELLTSGSQVLTGSKYLWLYAAENLPEKHQERFSILKALNLRTGRAWVLKENLRSLWNFTSLGWAQRHWRRWYFWATHSRLKPVIKTARMVQRHLANVMTYYHHRITNAVSEGLNSKIQTIKKRAYGFRNREHFKTAIYFNCGGLDLYPATHSIP
jgi:transposase